MRILLSGSSGLIGTELLSFLRVAGHSVTRLVRRPAHEFAREIAWNPAERKLDPAALEAFDAVIHLGGVNIAGKRWSMAYKQEILDSRVQTTTLLASTLAALRFPPQVMVCASAVGFYGDRGEQTFDEQASAGHGFLPTVCRAWEEAAQVARDHGIRVAHLRIGVVLSTAGGALAKMLTPFRLGLGGRIGSGQQFMSWIHIDDLVEAFHHTLLHEELRGPVNATSPNPVTNAEFTATLGRVLGRPTIFPLPACAARLALGEMADELLLASQRVVPAKLQASGFSFKYPELVPALRQLLGK
jgi:hypothetical protein